MTFPCLLQCSFVPPPVTVCTDREHVGRRTKPSWHRAHKGSAKNPGRLGSRRPISIGGRSWSLSVLRPPRRRAGPHGSRSPLVDRPRRRSTNSVEPSSGRRDARTAPLQGTRTIRKSYPAGTESDPAQGLSSKRDRSQTANSEVEATEDMAEALTRDSGTRPYHACLASSSEWYIQSARTHVSNRDMLRCLWSGWVEPR